MQEFIEYQPASEVRSAQMVMREKEKWREGDDFHDERSKIHPEGPEPTASSYFRGSDRKLEVINRRPRDNFMPVNAITAVAMHSTGRSMSDIQVNTSQTEAVRELYESTS